MSHTTAAPSGRRPARLLRPIRRTPLTVMAFLGLGTVVVVLVLALVVGQYVLRSAYQAGHQPTPTAAADAMLYAMLHDRDTSSVGKYLCDAAIERRVDNLIQRITVFTKSGKNTIDYNWDTHQTYRSGNRATDAATIEATVTQNDVLSRNPPEHWKLAMRNQGGWKVCSLTTG